MSDLSVIIPSRNAANLVPCVAAVRKHEPDIRIIVIDNGLERRPDGCEFIDWFKPFVFASACNAGIVAAGDSDVCLLNDDALLETPGGFTRMQQAAKTWPEFGLISATTNIAGNIEQHPRLGSGIRYCGQTPGNSFPVVAFVCVLIPRRTIDAVGLLDERFDPGMYEDNDYCRRAHNAGLKIGIHDGCFVNHNCLTPTFRSSPKAGAQLDAARKIYLSKWGTV